MPNTTSPNTSLVDALLHVDDLAGILLDAGRPAAVEIPAADLLRRPDVVVRAAIPNRATGNTYATTRVRVTHRIPNAGDVPSHDETVDLDVVGVSAPVIGIGGSVLTGFRVDGELPIVSIVTSRILAIEALEGDE